MDIKSATEYFKAWVDSDKINGMTDDLAGYRVQAYEALKEKAEREKGCEYCNEMKDMQYEENSVYIDRNGKLDINGEDMQLNYCPNCSRKLGELKC